MTLLVQPPLLGYYIPLQSSLRSFYGRRRRRATGFPRPPHPSMITIYLFPPNQRETLCQASYPSSLCVVGLVHYLTEMEPTLTLYWVGTRLAILPFPTSPRATKPSAFSALPPPLSSSITSYSYFINSEIA
uniref:Uncharacterized protein n=1 Tax=Picea glauca TaxID=3330 RepID=A0A101M4U1_PICGL|nr:hypothetical protein ABT39_MTgene750 [Picea glauca]